MVIDLCLSDDDAGASVPRVSKSTEGAIDLCSSSDDEAPPPAKRAKVEGAKVEGAKVEGAPLAPRVRDDDDDDEDCFAVAAPPARAAPPAAALGDDEDIVITSHSGALSDFPHSREHQRPVAVYPEELAEPAGFSAAFKLRPYQRQSLAFCVNAERQTGASPPPPGAGGERGGWLCDEVGMGKTAVVVALALACPAAGARPGDAEWAAVRTALTWKRRPAEFLGSWRNRIPNPAYGRWLPPPRVATTLRLKTTLVLTNVSLVGQWEDEIKKFAPGLVVARFYGSDKLSPKKLADWRDVDVLVSTFTTKFKVPNVFGDLLVDSLRFHRIVVDEIHLTFQSADFRQLKADRKWAVTGTPMTTAVDHLSRSASFLGVHGQISGQMQAYRRAFETPGADCVLARKKQDAFDGLVAALKLRMIRHTKAMRLGGAVALALPDELAATVALDFSDRERAAYREDYALGAHRRNRIRGGGATKFTVEMTLAKSRHACQRSKAKRAALLADLEARRGRARGCRAVIFTEYKDVHAELVRDLRQTFPSFRVFEFSGGTDANVRHRSIREFQADEGPPDRIFVITMRAGSVGITLTAADVVYLLGPCVDPADEVQAAGRIHRLGQSSDVLIKKFVVNGTASKVVRKGERGT
ncbi:helicase [Aureococcus anophagefferens]|nr:helicase [Aureococcus anophagefferens]